jgi:geranyl-CoA carboxylase alpha subunit
VVHLFERDCSAQRRHQKVVEEAPSPAVPPELRARMGAAAVTAARAIGYVGAGTVEMLLGADGSFHFMEMNTRLQVEHPVTEMITGLDLVALQLDVAAGRPLPFTQEDLQMRGHAIEVRLYAEDPANGFLPRTGRVARWSAPDAPGVRVDHGLLEGAEITADYDAMVAKLIAHGRDREEARRRLLRALETTTLHGVETNHAFLLATLRHPRFAAGEVDTGFVEAHLDALAPAPAPDAAWALAGALLAAPGLAASWSSSGGAGARIFRLACGEEDVDLVVTPRGAELEVAGRGLVTLLDRSGSQVRFRFEGVDRSAVVTERPDGLEVSLDGPSWRFARAPASRAAAAGPSAGAVLAPMAGAVVAVRAEDGERVASGAVIAVVEAMKMQLELTAPRAGRVAGLELKPGDQVKAKQVVAEIAPEEDNP